MAKKPQGTNNNSSRNLGTSPLLLSLFGEAADAVQKSAENLGVADWIQEKGVIGDHMRTVDGEMYSGGVDVSGSRFRLATVLYNADSHKTRETVRFDEAGIKSTALHRVIAAELVKNSLIADLEALQSQDTIRQVGELCIPERGLAGNEVTLTGTDGYTAVTSFIKQNHPKANEQLHTAIWMAMLAQNGYITKLDVMRDIAIEDEIGADLDLIKRDFAGYHIAEALAQVSLAMKDANRALNDRAKIGRSVFEQEAATVLDGIHLKLRRVAIYLKQMDAMFFYIRAYVTQNLVDIPEFVEADVAKWCTNLTLVRIALENKFENPNLSDEAAMMVLDRFGEYMQSESTMLRGATLAEMASKLNVAYTRHVRDDQVEACIITTDQSRAANRTVFFEAGTLGSYSKMFKEEEVVDGINALLIPDYTFVSAKKADSVLRSVLQQTELSAGLVFDFSSVSALERKNYIEALAITRAHKVAVAKIEDTFRLVYYIRPTVILSGRLTQVSLDSMMRTDDPYEVIMLTGEQVSTAILPGFDYTINLTPGTRNLVRYVSEEKKKLFTMNISKPVYQSTINYQSESGEMREVELKTTPLDMLNLTEVFDDIYTTRSGTNMNMDSLQVRKLVTAWLVLDAQVQLRPNDQGLATTRRSIAQKLVEALIDTVIGNPAAFSAVSALIRKIANEQGVFKTYRRFFTNEILVAQVTAYIGAVLLCQLGGMRIQEIKAIMKMIDEVDAIALSVGEDFMAKVLQHF